MRRAALASVRKAVVLVLVLVLGSGAAPPERGFVDLPHAERSSALNPGQYLKHWLLSPKAAGVDRTTRVTDKTTTRTITAGHKAGRLRTGPGTAGPDKRAQMLKMISALEEMDRALHSTLSSRISLLPRANGRNSGRRNKVPPGPEGGVKPPGPEGGVKPPGPEGGVKPPGPEGGVKPPGPEGGVKPPGPEGGVKPPGPEGGVKPPGPEGGVKPTTVAPAAVDSTVSRASGIVPSLTGRSFKKSIGPQTKKTNKRVCFWKYCSQN
ncbi:translation initiation factor IF-2-like [Pseudoliparis swirei]|uniref:translation initiation factor IF-2-like n=1 Tax=Pseudoliparis swirei TaxID=2059687 RepID=UPI0024BEC363|nr:translation initiation factor IF-2-like [Pseudoliparis swirei]